MTTATDLAVADDDAGTDRKKLVLVGGLVAALLAGGGGYLLLSGGGGGDDLALGVPPAARAAQAAKPAKAATPAKKPAVLPAATAVRLGRDPFVALYVQPAAGAADPTGTGTTSGTGTTTTGGTSTTGGATSTPTVTTSAPYSLSLVSITGAATEGKVFTYTVGGARKSVVAAQKFGKYGELVTLAPLKNDKGVIIGALIQVGDDDPVAIKLGEKLTVL